MPPSGSGSTPPASCEVPQVWRLRTTKSSSSRFDHRCLLRRASRLTTHASSAFHMFSRGNGSASTSIPRASGVRRKEWRGSSTVCGAGSLTPLAESLTPRPRCITRSAACSTTRTTRPPSSSASLAQPSHGRSHSSSPTRRIGTISPTRPTAMDIARRLHPRERPALRCGLDFRVVPCTPG